MRILVKSLLLAALCWIAAPASADTYPSRPVKIIVPFAPGGGNDTLGRLLGAELEKSLGQPVVIENRPGGSTMIGVEAAASSDADGYTLLYTSSLALNELLYSASSRKTRDFAPVAWMTTLPILVNVNPSMPKTLKEIVDYAKQNPGKLNYGTFGKGTIPHLACEMLESSLGVDMVDIAYRGGGPTTQALLTGEIQLLCDNLGSIQFIRDGRLRAVALMSRERSPSAPEIPTFAELGYPDLVAGISHGVYAPAGTPPEVIATLNREINKALKTERIAKRLLTIGGIPGGGGPDALAAVVEDDRAKWGAVIRQLKLDLSNK